METMQKLLIQKLVNIEKKKEKEASKKIYRESGIAVVVQRDEDGEGFEFVEKVNLY